MKNFTHNGNRYVLIMKEKKCQHDLIILYINRHFNKVYIYTGFLDARASQSRMALLQWMEDGNYLEPSANMDYNKSSEYFVFQLFIENLILIKYPWAGIHG